MLFPRSQLSSFCMPSVCFFTSSVSCLRHVLIAVFSVPSFGSWSTKHLVHALLDRLRYDLARLHSICGLQIAKAASTREECLASSEILNTVSISLVHDPNSDVSHVQPSSCSVSAYTPITNSTTLSSSIRCNTSEDAHMY